MDSTASASKAPPESPVDKKIGELLRRLVTSGEAARKRFLKSGYEIMRYGFSPDYAFEYQSLNPNAWFKAKYGKTAEAMQTIVPSLVQTTPYRLLTPRPTASPESVARAEVMSDYVNYVPGVVGHAHHSRRATEEAVGYGRGVRWTGREAKSGLITSQYDTVRNLLIDSNARIWPDVRWVARIRERPKWEACADYKDVPGADAIINALDVASTRKSDTYASYDWEKNDNTTDNIRYYEFYLSCGIHHFKGGSEILKEMAKAGGQQALSEDQAQAASYTADDSPMKYVVSESGRLIAKVPWEIPFHIMPADGWPCTVLDFYNNPDSIWPVSPLEPGIGFQRAMNHIITLLMGKFRYTCKTVLAIKKQGRNGVSSKDKDKVLPRLSNQDVEAIEIEMSGATDNMSLKSFIEQFDYSNEYVGAGLQLLDTYERKYERLTGLTEFISTGNTQTQDRSAAAAQIKDRNSRNRIEDMRDREAEHESLLARKEAFAARYLLNRDDIAKSLGPQAAQAWGFLASPEATQPQYWLMQAQQQGMTDPNMMQQFVAQQMSQVVDINTFALEIDYSIESASVRRKDIDQQLDLMKEINNQVTPIQMQSPNPMVQALAYDQLAAYYKLAGLPKDLIQKNLALAAMLRMPPPLPPPGMPGAPPGPPGMNGPPGAPPQPPGPPGQIHGPTPPGINIVHQGPMTVHAPAKKGK